MPLGEGYVLCNVWSVKCLCLCEWEVYFTLQLQTCLYRYIKYITAVIYLLLTPKSTVFIFRRNVAKSV